MFRPALLFVPVLVLVLDASAVAQEWPSFRGPRGSGVSSTATPPATWNVSTSANVAWRTPIAGLGHSSPIVWGDRVYVTTAVSDAAASRALTLGDSDTAGIDPAKDMVPRPLQATAVNRTKYGVIYYGSTAPAMDEAIHMIEGRGHQLDRMRIRAFPFHSSVNSFVADHDFVFVVEQNRDAQLRSLIVNECGIDPVRLVPILHYDGTPITARFIAKAIGDHLDQLKVTPMKVSS